jgi:initiation factor 1A
MVKNTTGGSRAKGLARKSENQQSFKLRMSECPDEKYAVAKKIFGGSRCEVICDDHVTRQGIIRGKFSGKNKRRNIIGPGTIVLVGIRSWASVKEGKTEECDILEVYSTIEVDQLKQRPNFPTDFFNDSIRDMFGSSKAENKTDEFVFTTEEAVETMSQKLPEDTVFMDTGEEISLDDI